MTQTRTPERKQLLDTFAAACDYPGEIKPDVIEVKLAEYLKALGVERKIVHLESPWNLADHPSLDRYVNRALDDFVKRIGHPKQAARAAQDARAARAAQDASAQSAMRRFAQWCVLGYGWWYWRFEISWVATTYIGAVQNDAKNVQEWSKPLFDAFVGGCWLIHFTDDTLYWVAKPSVHVERTANGRRLHAETGPAFECDVENLYFWHGVMVPAYAVTYPQWITVEEIEKETNAEVRRILIERYGQSRYLLDAGAQEIHRDECGTLYRKEIEGDEPLVMVKVKNATPEPDNTFKDYFRRVPPEMATAREAVAWSFDVPADEYELALQT